MGKQFNHTKKPQKGKGKNEQIKTTFGANKAKKHQQNNTKGMPKWQNQKTEIDKLEERIKKETPPVGTLYYKFKPQDEGAE